MKSQARLNSFSQMAWSGFSGGVILTYGYAGLFFCYAAIRIILSASSIDVTNMSQTVFLLLMSLLLTVLVFAALIALLAGLLGAATAVIAYIFHRWLPVHFTLIGASLVVAILIHLFLFAQIGSNLFSLYFSTYIFWLGLPTIVYIAYSAFVSRQYGTVLSSRW